MEPMQVNPRLRVMPVAVEIQGRQMLMFQDPDRFTEETVLMPMEAAAIVQFLDGGHSVREIQEALTRASGQIIDSQLIEDMVAQLDEHLLLESPRFHEHVRALSEQWAALKVRPPSQAGQSYPEDKEELIKFLDAFYTATDGPGALPEAPKANDLKAIIAPHMDLSESGPVGAHAFKALAEHSEARLFVIFGTGHMEPQRMFVPTDKDFVTPLGVMPTDRELVARIQRLRADRNPLNDYVHKTEHSIEFMVLLLQHALRGRDGIRIVPVLASGVSPCIVSRTPPESEPAFKEFMGALKLALSERNEPVCFIAGADLAHLGPRYGDKEHWAPIRMAEEEEMDRKMLAPLASADQDGFFQEIAGQMDRRRICGLPPIYALMHASGAVRSELLKWGYWHDRSTHSVVTFASMSVY
ncbi:MAG TPA: AmmeMemoRadiSam system protein B [bacterium]|nr:AmmeMemoRadiSam system protein B [bacterium]